VQEKEFIFLRLPVLREYLERELRMDGLPFPFDLEVCQSNNAVSGLVLFLLYVEGH
jgi:5'-3' exonuclease